MVGGIHWIWESLPWIVCQWRKHGKLYRISGGSAGKTSRGYPQRWNQPFAKKPNIRSLGYLCGKLVSCPPPANDGVLFGRHAYLGAKSSPSVWTWYGFHPVDRS